MVFCCILIFFKNSFRNAIKVAISLDPDQDQHSVGPDLGPNCLQKSLADDTSAGKEFKCMAGYLNGI